MIMHLFSVRLASLALTTFIFGTAANARVTVEMRKAAAIKLS